MKGGLRNRVLGRCAGVLFISGGLASVPANALLTDPRPSDWVHVLSALAVVSGLLCMLVPWDRIDRQWLHLIPPIACAEVVITVVTHGPHGDLFLWFFVLTSVYTGYAFRSRAQVAFHMACASLSMVSTGVYMTSTDPDAIARVLVGLPTLWVSAGVVVWLRENLERRERTDPLTGLDNRRALMEELATGNPGLLALFDLDGFKRYNDRLGHAAGDALLERVSARLETAVAGRGRAFRLGGDELCVVLTDDTALDDCWAALHEAEITASYGTARIPDEADTPSTALSLADDRMYEAKRALRAVPFVAELVTDTPTAGQSASRSASPSPSESARSARSLSTRR